MTTRTRSHAAVWQIDNAHTQAQFAVRHMMVSSVKGRFAELSGEIHLDEDDPARSSVQVTIDAASIDTRSEQRDAHLRSADFFAVEAYPELTFRSTRVEATGEDAFRVEGDLTIRDVTRPVVLEVERLGRSRTPWGTEVVGFEARTRIERDAFGVRWNQALETGGVLVGNEVRITLDVQAVLKED
jgi:polyisoprenoid-binding protein YceI